MNESNCCFTGHRVIPKNRYFYVRARLSEEILKKIREGITGFICGGALGFDTLAAQMVLDFRDIFPQISLILCLPCKNQTRGWQKNDVDTYNSILARADKTIFLSDEYYNGCMHKRNRTMVDSSSSCIAYLEENKGGTFFTVNYALKNGRNVIYI